ncbi:phosphoribosylanthranilate isomerase [Rhodopirellula sallentina]|uniref:N-(5'-phosphoribosyl)anthranilate isomerase n=1 Tax=Rhodopirellula sallentina SM41 TaxID=1263870 RepID=M5UM84_9BACT|nr:phosphoribosylanthranilate isomerase [Rhodopirellula sallentina]EMI57118.1 N-(5-phosphoribosyl)anthranilate isomerase [Rhodopirellula sallentina SM41]
MIDFQIKICGVRTESDVRVCETAGADCVGLNFFPRSIRYLPPDSPDALAVSRCGARAGIVRVGLFVNEKASEILRVQSLLQLDAVQLHGDETVADAEELLNARIPVIRAIRLPTTALSLEEIAAKIGKWADVPVALLLDADAGAQFGGGGKQLHWPSIASWAEESPQQAGQPSWILAGGLNSENVAKAIQTSGATRVDVASGVESPKGTKSPELIQKFVSQCVQRGVDVER